MGTSASGAIKARIRNLIAACAALALSLGLAPTMSAADESVAGALVAPEVNGDAQSTSPNSILASTLTSDGVSVISADVLLGDAAASEGSNTVIGSFTVNGLTFAVTNDGGLTLVSVSPNSVGASFVLAPYENSTDSGDGAAIAIPSTITYNGITYPVTAIGPYAFYLSGATQVSLPASVTSVDDRAFRSSDVESVPVDADNPNLASFDGALYDASLASLLLIPEGRTGVVLLPSETEVVEPSLFSHCSLVEAIDVEEGDAAFASWEGLLYDASGTTLLRVPAGATEITIREGCTTIAAGAMEGCAKLERINAPSTVTSISPDVFESVPTISLPAMTLQDESVAASLDAERSEASPFRDVGAESAPADNSAEAEDEAEVSPRRVVASSQGLEAPLALPDLGSTSASSSATGQLNAMVALSSVEDSAPEVDPASIQATLPEGADAATWQAVGISVGELPAAPDASIQSAVASYALPGDVPNSGNVYSYHIDGQPYVGLYPATGATSSGPGMKFGYGWNNKTDANGNSFVAKYEAKYGWYIVRDGTSYMVYSKNKATSLSFSPRGANIAANTSVQGKAVYFRVGNVIEWSCAGGNVDGYETYFTSVANGAKATSPVPTREGYVCTGWYTAASGGTKVCDAGGQTGAITTHPIYYAQWVPLNLSFDVDSEPADEDYPADEYPSIYVPDAIQDDGTIQIEDPKRPGYVFQGWTIPDAATDEGSGAKEALDQDLVYQGDDGKWYVDASKLSDYTVDGKVELTARWTSIISVDVPSSVTFYADVVTQGQESREGAVSNAFGQSKVSNQSQVDLRVVGLESEAVETTDATLGADSILKKAAAATPATSAQKLLSLYPSAKAWTAEELQDPDAVGGAKATTAVDFDLDDLLLEASFVADDFTIPAGDTLNMGYRLNLTETGQELDYDKLSTLEDGQSAAIANVSYCFSAGGHFPTATGSKDDPLYIEHEGRIYGLQDIKDSANCIAELGEASPCYGLYRSFLEAQILNNGQPGSSPYFQLKVGNVYLPLQLIGIGQDKTAAGDAVGLTFQMRDIYAFKNLTSTAAGSTAFMTQMNTYETNAGGWLGSAIYGWLGGRDRNGNDVPGSFWNKLDPSLQAKIVPVVKYQQLTGSEVDSNTKATLQLSTSEAVWLPSMYEVFGITVERYNASEGLTDVSGYVPFQYAAYEGNNGSTNNAKAIKEFNGVAQTWWFRSAYMGDTYRFSFISGSGALDYGFANGWHGTSYGIVPAFCL